MKILKSIKWRLQLWYGLILVVVLAGFGGTAYQLERNRLFGQIDNELHRRVGVLANALHRPMLRGQNGNRPPRLGQNFGEPGPEQVPGDDVPPQLQRNRPPPVFHLPDRDAHYFDPGDPHGFYYAIRTEDGNEIAASTNQPDRGQMMYDYYFNRRNHVAESDTKGFRPPKIVSSQGYRDAGDVLPSGEIIWVGCSIAPELRQLRHTALNLIMAGGLILLVGLLGGWWMVSRSLRPVSQISVTATKISAGDLSQRINVAETESELGRLAAVLNSTFARLETAFAQQKQFASDAAHELRTPVTVILTQTQTALNRERDAASYKQTVEACQRAAQRMRKLIESLLELARFDAGQEILSRLPFDLAQTVKDSLELVQPLAEEFQVKMFSEISTAEIVGDSGRLGQVVTNLLSNAIQYNQPGGEVRVQLEMQNGLAVLTVADTGQGIAAENLPRVFERFYRADVSRTGAGNAGLGLSICKAIVEAHGGTIEVASEAGQGSTFAVRLPV